MEWWYELHGRGSYLMLSWSGFEQRGWFQVKIVSIDAEKKNNEYASMADTQNT